MAQIFRIGGIGEEGIDDWKLGIGWTEGKAVLSELLATERGCVEDQPQQPACRIQSSLPTPLCNGKLLRLASEAQPRSTANNSESTASFAVDLFASEMHNKLRE